MGQNAPEKGLGRSTDWVGPKARKASQPSCRTTKHGHQIPDRAACFALRRLTEVDQPCDALPAVLADPALIFLLLVQLAQLGCQGSCAARAVVLTARPP